ncbi:MULTISPECIES: hypothetical protein [Streptomyces rochei group]|uniref:hypothetical protein n=1 Tax=Streptomyces rochei group TaxID=2867164 RepID=UPI0018744F68|nr:hypothetical protein [Streptomyces vinaceusdrappus]GHC37027.1 hypothetical protein GCM10010308_64450 [Streptomyces vinaceusdrappus]
MTMPTSTPTVSPFSRDPFYAMGFADAYDEYQAGETIDTLKIRANMLLDVDYPENSEVQPAELYRLGYCKSVAGLVRGHIATVNAQCEVAQTTHARKQGREKSTLHQRNRTRR